MKQTTLIPSPPQANRLKDFFGNGQEGIIADHLLENFQHWVRKKEMTKDIEEKTGHYPGNWTARTDGIKNKLKKIFELWGRLLIMEHNDIFTESDSAYRIIEVETTKDVGLPEKVMV